MNADKIQEANLKAVENIISSEPYWIDVLPAEEVLENYSPDTILHSGPPIEYKDMCILHKKAMLNAVLLEGFADTEEEAESLIQSGKVKIDSALNYNTVGSGTGIITRSVPLLVVKDMRTGRVAGVFPHEGRYGGGFCGWGVYSKEIAENLKYMRETLFGPARKALGRVGGVALKPIIAQSLSMGDENHSSQTAADAVFIKEILPLLLECENSKEIITYFVQSKRFFHNYGQAASRCAVISSDGIELSSMVTAAGGNGVEYGIKVAGLPGEWFTAPSPMIRGRYMSKDADEENQLPWIGDSSIVECAGLGGILSAASPTVCSWRNQSLQDGIALTNKMYEICVSANRSYEVPNINFKNPPVGIDILKVLEKETLPVINGGMIDKNGGWMGAGCTNIPMQCFEKATARFKEVYCV